MNTRDFKRLKKIARERGGGEITKRRNKWPAIKKAKKKKMPKTKGRGRTILVKGQDVL